MFLPSIVTQNKSLRRVAFAVGDGETTRTGQFVLKSLQEMCPAWVKQHAFPSLMLDAKLHSEAVHDVLPSASLHTCIWHWLGLEFPAKMRRKLGNAYDDGYQAVRRLVDARTPEEFEISWESFKAQQPAALVSYMQYWYSRKKTWSKVCASK
jgi:hypothetical protein